MLNKVHLLSNMSYAFNDLKKNNSLYIFFLQEFKLWTDFAFRAARMTQYLEPAPGNKLHTIRTPIIKSITHVEASTHQLSAASHTGCLAGQVRSLPGVLFVCVCVFVFPQMSVNPFFCVCGFVGLIINARVSKNVYICVIIQAFVSAGRGAVPSANANGFAVFDLHLGWPQKTGAHFYESDMSSHSNAGHGNTSTHKVLR